MALTAAQYRDKAEYALSKAEANLPVVGPRPDMGVAWTQVASSYAYLYELQSKIDGTLTV